MYRLLISCDHATCAIPEAHRALFKGREDVVTSSVGWDPGALNLAQAFSMKCRTPLVHSDVTRLLVDVAGEGDGRWSEFTRDLPPPTLVKIQDRYMRPYQQNLENRIRVHVERSEPVLHINVRTAEGGNDSVRLGVPKGQEGALRLAGDWRDAIRASGLEVRLDAAFPQTALMAGLDAQFGGPGYQTIKLQAPQSSFLSGQPVRWEVLKKTLLATLMDVLGKMEVNLSPEDSSNL